MQLENVWGTRRVGRLCDKENPRETKDKWEAMATKLGTNLLLHYCGSWRTSGFVGLALPWLPHYSL